MSAFIVSTEAITVLVEAARRWVSGYEHDGEWKTVKQLDAREIGQMLMAENAKSVNFRYRESAAPGLFHPVRTPEILSAPPMVVLRTLHCYEYQACEHDGWEASEAHAFIRALEGRAIRKLPGYGDARAFV